MRRFETRTSNLAGIGAFLVFALAAVLLLGFAGTATAGGPKHKDKVKNKVKIAKVKAADDGVCSGLEKAAFGLCKAYCGKKACATADPESKSCQSLRKVLLKKTGSSVFPCDLPASLCGNGVVDVEEWEECDGEDDVVCPGLCTPPGSDLECTCGPTPAPSLVGLDPNKDLILPITVQAAYNDDTMFFNIEWDGDRGDYHDYVHFTGGAWQREGFPRREAQSTIDSDPRRGPTNRTSTIYESRVTFMVDDPNGPNAVPGFGRLGCFVTCHDNSRAMPTWDLSDFTKYLNDGTPGTLDLWHHRQHRANPIGASDDQHVTTIPPGGDAGGRFGDAGSSPWQTNNIVGGVPTFALDPDTTHGLFAFDFNDVFGIPYRYYRREDAPELGAGPVAVGIDYAVAVAMGYVPQEGDTIPRRRLRTPEGSRGDISGLGSMFTPSLADPLMGRIMSNTQRLLNTGNPDDTALAHGNTYNVAFAVHTGMVTVRDHYVGFPMTLSLGNGAADIEAVQIPGSGRDVLPDFSDTNTFPEEEVNLFLPGITSLEFLKNENIGLDYLDPDNGNNPVGQVHAGAGGIGAGAGCRDCHTATGGGLSMEVLVPRRGGVNTPTPIPPPPAP